MGIKNFKDKGTEDINYGRNTKAALRLLPRHLHKKAQIKLARIGAAGDLRDLRGLQGNRFKVLKGDRKDQCSIRINDQYRVCFSWVEDGAENVEIVDYHK